jgi:hypothetical protein
MAALDFPAPPLTDGQVYGNYVWSSSKNAWISTPTSTYVSQTNGTVTTASSSSTVVRNITTSTSVPSGGSDGDIWMRYA